MSGLISGNMVGSYSQIGKTFILTDENGTELTGVVVDQETIFTAGDNDVREGKVYASDAGVSTGTKFIPSYVTSEGFRLIPAGSDFILTLWNGQHEYTKLQAIFCPFNSSISNSVGADRVAIENNVYSVQSVVAESTITISDPDVVNFGITNTSDVPCLIRYFTYKEVY